MPEIGSRKSIMSMMQVVLRAEAVVVLLDEKYR